MTRDDIIRMAREAGMEQEGLMFYSPYDDEFDVHIDHLEKFTELVAAEREACAIVCEQFYTESDAEFYRSEFASAIRAKEKQ